MTTPASEAAVLELRVLSGLQAGAALPLEEALTVGPGDDADLLLLDDGRLPARLLVRVTPEGGLLLETVEDGVVLSTGTRLAGGQTVPLAPGEAFRTGDTWLMVRDAMAPWDTWTPPLTDEPETATPEGAHSARGPSASPVMVADVRSVGTGSRDPSRRPRPMRTLGSLIVAAGLLSTMLGVAALVRQVKDSEAVIESEDETKKGRASATDPRRKRPTADGASPPPPVARETGGATAAGPPDAQPDVRTDVHGGRGRLHVNIPGDGTVVLPFDIQEVILGSGSHVTLTDGRRIEPGDRVGDWRLAEIRPGTLVFDGPRKVQIGW